VCVLFYKTADNELRRDNNLYMRNIGECELQTTDRELRDQNVTR